MTFDERRTTLTALWEAAHRLVPNKDRAAFQNLQVAIESILNDHGDERLAEADDTWQRTVTKLLEDDRAASFRAGMLAVKKRSDYRNLDDIQDPEELRSIH